MSFKISNKGFTLIELLVVVLLITVISIISSDMIISLTSTSAKVQNKIELEEEYSFLNAKLTKLIQDADYVTYNSATKVLSLKYSTKTDLLKYDEANAQLSVDDSIHNLPLSSAEIGKTSPFKIEVTGTNPQVVYITFGISKDSNNARLKTDIKFEKRITLNKTYQE